MKGKRNMRSPVKALREALAEFLQPTLPGMPRTRTRHRTRHSTESLRAKRRQRVAGLRQQGLTHQAIAGQVGWSESTVQRDLTLFPELARTAEASRALYNALMGKRSQMARAATRIIRQYDSESYGGGGPCDDIAGELLAIGTSVHVPGKEVDGDVRGWAGDHAFAVIWTDDEIYSVDVPYSLYETGGGYTWDVDTETTIRPNDVTIDKAPDAARG